MWSESSDDEEASHVTHSPKFASSGAFLSQLIAKKKESAEATAQLQKLAHTKRTEEKAEKNPAALCEDELRDVENVDIIQQKREGTIEGSAAPLPGKHPKPFGNKVMDEFLAGVTKPSEIAQLSYPSDCDGDDENEGAIRSRRDSKSSEAGSSKETKAIVKKKRYTGLAIFTENDPRKLKPDSFDSGVNALALLCALVLAIPYQVRHNLHTAPFIGVLWIH
jgi:hypothetical protein